MSSPTKRDRFKQLQRQTQATLRRMQDEWWVMKAAEIQHYCDTKNSKKFFGAIKTVFGPPKPSNAPLKSTDGNVLKEKQAIYSEFGSARQHPQKTHHRFSRRLPTLQELNVAIQQTSAGKAPGKDSIPADIFKAMGPIALDSFHTLLTNIWEGKTCPRTSEMLR
ncbi:hypothetical protein Bbelb_430220 [Branchiostoma belcheri]|nr:hypothetical protein Bbelb_430220 [Branchiostoma belcheri]